MNGEKNVSSQQKDCKWLNCDIVSQWLKRLGVLVTVGTLIFGQWLYNQPRLPEWMYYFHGPVCTLDQAKSQIKILLGPAIRPASVDLKAAKALVIVSDETRLVDYKCEIGYMQTPPTDVPNGLWFSMEIGLGTEDDPLSIGFMGSIDVLMTAEDKVYLMKFNVGEYTWEVEKNTISKEKLKRLQI